MQKIQSVALIGMGALGILYGHTMARKMKEGAVTFLVDEKRKQRYRADPPTFNGEPCRFAFCAPGDYPGEAELLIFGVKGTQLKEAIESVRPVVGPETIIVSLLNGITSETILEEAFPQATVLYSVAQGMAATRVGTHVTGAQIEGNVLFFAPRADEAFVTRSLFAAKLVVEVRTGDVIPLPAQKMQ